MEIEKSLLDLSLNQSYCSQTTIAKKQLECPPVLDLQDKWHLSDDEEQRERILPSANLNISWLLKTKQDIAEAFYADAARDGAC